MKIVMDKIYKRESTESNEFLGGIKIETKVYNGLKMKTNQINTRFKVLKKQ